MSKAKQCIWCSKDEQSVTFDTKAHSIPKKLGGKNICLNVCDSCNSYFGNAKNKLPSIETVIKEAFNITRGRLLNRTGGIGKNKPMPKYSSEFFNINKSFTHLSLKAKYKVKPGFQDNIGRLLKRGIYKMFLEEWEITFGNAKDKKFDFVREFARYDLNDPPLLYYWRKFPAIMMSNEWLIDPSFQLNENDRFKYLIKHPQFFEFEFLSHLFSIPISRSYMLTLSNYLELAMPPKQKYFHTPILIKNFNDMDIPLSSIS